MQQNMKKKDYVAINVNNGECKNILTLVPGAGIQTACTWLLSNRYHAELRQ